MKNIITSLQELLLEFCAESLFNKKAECFEDADFVKLVDEAHEQTVLTVVGPTLKKSAGIDVFDDVRFMRQVTKNAGVCRAHEEIHKVLCDNGVDYVVLKGVASASYYKQLALRTMGDVDLLVRKDDLEKCDILLATLGYSRLGEIDTSKGHIRYVKREGNLWITCEVHHRINGVPDAMVGIEDKYFKDVFKKAVLYKEPNSTCIIPDKFHHGLVLILHTATHLTSEGIGLRHLCDWAVFINSFDNQEFVATFERALGDFGLWEFAKLISLCCVKYLGCEYKEWMGEADDSIVDEIILDFFDGGNFGNKDEKRNRQIKYIKNANNKTVDKKSPALQAFHNIDLKAKGRFAFAKKHKLLRPIGWVLVVCEYVGLVISGRRKPDDLTTVSKANTRKELYSKFHLFETDGE